MARTRSVDYREVLQKRREGMKYEDLAKHFDIAIGAAHYMVCKAIEEEAKNLESQSPSEFIRQVEQASQFDTKELTDKEVVYSDVEIARLKATLSVTKKKYQQALDEIAKTKETDAVWKELNSHKPSDISIKDTGKKNTHSTAVGCLVLSDWHVDEVVQSEVVNYLNEYNPKIAEQRATNIFRVYQKLINILRNGTNIDETILFLLGDFITGYLHEGDEENNSMSPIDGIMFAEDLLSAGIEFLWKEGKFKRMFIKCKIGNHARTSKKIKYATGSSNSYETLLYHHLAHRFKGNKNIIFSISDAYHDTADIMGFKYRYHHGDAIRYAGGIGGITVPANKAIAQWNKAVPVYYDIFGHLHTRLDGGRFLSNGSLIGYNAYAIREKFDFELPQQWMFLSDKRGKTLTWPIYANKADSI